MAYGYGKRIGGMVRFRYCRQAQYELDKGLDFFLARAAGTCCCLLDVHRTVFAHREPRILAGKPDDTASFSHSKGAGHVAGEKQRLHGGFSWQILGYDCCQ